DVLPDSAFKAAAAPDRNVVLYGNADTNGAWGELLKDSPVQVRRGTVTVGERKLTREDLACLFLRPRPGSDRACVGVVGGTGQEWAGGEAADGRDAVVRGGGGLPRLPGGGGGVAARGEQGGARGGVLRARLGRGVGRVRMAGAARGSEALTWRRERGWGEREP